MPRHKQTQQDPLITNVSSFENRYNAAAECLDKEVWSQLPLDLLSKVFARLPFGSLFKVLVLSKEWNRKIRSAEFQREVTAAADCSTWESFCPILCSDRLQMVAFSRKANRWFKLYDLSEVLGEANRASRGTWVMAGAAGSLVCVKGVWKPWHRRLIVANPMLKSYRDLPPRRSEADFPRFPQLLDVVHLICEQSGADRDALLSRYKVISVSQVTRFRDAGAPVINPGYQRERYEDDDLDQHEDDWLEQYYEYQSRVAPIRVEIYNSTLGEWTESEYGMQLYGSVSSPSSVYRDGVLYLLIIERGYHVTHHLLAFIVETGAWITIPLPMPVRAYRFAQLVICGTSVLLVLPSADTETRPRDFGVSRLPGDIAPGTISIFSIEEDFRIVPVAEGPDKSIASVKIVEGISGDDECLYMQFFGRPLVVVYNLKHDRWSTLSLLDESQFPTLSKKMSYGYFGSSFIPGFSSPGLSSHFQPGLNPFLKP